ncbi:MAG: hypothetical protein MMC23_006775 [Stictis urceolatum]|nr:hypothetical protein [Stictis urceolata]
MPYTPNAPYARKGCGLCKKCKDANVRQEEAEDRNVPIETVLGVQLTNMVLVASMSRIACAFEKSEDKFIAMQELGLNASEGYEDERMYRKIYGRFREFMEAQETTIREVSALVLTRENAKLEIFEKVLKDAMGS